MMALTSTRHVVIVFAGGAGVVHGHGFGLHISDERLDIDLAADHRQLLLTHAAPDLLRAREVEKTAGLDSAKTDSESRALFAMLLMALHPMIGFRLSSPGLNIARPGLWLGPRGVCCMQQDPPEPDVEEQTRAWLEAQGYVWNPKRRSWGKGDPTFLNRLECRSGQRVLRWEGDQDLVPESTLTCIREATARLEEKLRDARKRALGIDEEKMGLDRMIKNCIMRPWAPYAWLILQLIALAFNVQLFAPELVHTQQESLFIPAAVALAFAPLLSSLRRERWVRQLGIEDQDGALERALADALNGGHALPSPWDWRASERKWCVDSLAGEGLASLNAALLWHGGLQSSIVASTTPELGDAAAAFLGVLAVSASATARTWYAFDNIMDGIPAELETCKSMVRRAESFYAMSGKSSEDVELSIRTVRAMSEAWKAKFALAIDTKATQLGLSFTSAAACAFVWELSGRTVVGPALARVFSAIDTYLLRPDTELTRVTLQLEEFTSERERTELTTSHD